MATREEIYQAIRAADAAGDGEAVKRLGAYLSSMSGGQWEDNSPLPTQPWEDNSPLPSGGLQGGASTPTTGQPSASAPAPAEGPATGAATPNPQAQAFVHGVDDEFVRGAYGLKQLFSKLTPEEQEYLRAYNATANADPNPGSRTLGNIAGGAAITAVPGAGVSKGIAAGTEALGMAALPKLSALMNTMGTSGALSFALSTGQGNDRNDQLMDKGAQALQDSTLVAPAMHAAGRVFGRTFGQMFAPSADAESLMAHGVQPTLQQGARGKVGQFIGGLWPQPGGVKTRQQGEVADAMTNRIAGDDRYSGQTPPMPLGDRSTNLNRDLLGEQETLLGRGRQIAITPQLLQRLDSIAAGVQTPNGAYGNQASRLLKWVMNMTGNSGHSVSAVDYQRNFLDPVTRAIANERDPRLRDAYTQIYSELVGHRNAPLTPPQMSTMNNIENRTLDLGAMNNATRGVPSGSTGIAPNRLGAAYDIPGPRNYSGTKEELVDPAVRTLNAGGPGGATSLLAAAKRAMGMLGGLGSAGAAAGNPFGALALATPAYALSALGQTRGGARYMFGDTGFNRAVQGGMSSLYPYLGAEAGYTVSPALNYLEQ